MGLHVTHNRVSTLYMTSEGSLCIWHPIIVLHYDIVKADSVTFCADATATTEENEPSMAIDPEPSAHNYAHSVRLRMAS